jgi:UDP-glucose 6-dehydrogenase
VEREPLGVVGASWVGLVTAAWFAELGHDVVVRDIAPDRIYALERGECPIHEPGLGEMLARNRSRLRYTENLGELLAAARIVFVCVGTPSTPGGDADLSAVGHLLDELDSPDADAAVIVTEWPELLDLMSGDVRDAMRTPLLVDGRNLLDPAAARAAGFIYEAIGRPSALVPQLPRAEEPACGLL